MELRVVTPKGAKVETTVSGVTAPGVVGELGILPGHRPLLTALGIGELEFQCDNGKNWLSVNGGFMEVHDDLVVIITETAETPTEIDVERAQKALDAAKAELGTIDATREEAIKMVEDTIKRAENRIAVSKREKREIPGL